MIFVELDKIDAPLSDLFDDLAREELFDGFHEGRFAVSSL
jgi:hypothetical protein